MIIDVGIKVYGRLLMVAWVGIRLRGPLAQGASWKAWLIRSWLLWTVRVAVLLAYGIVLEGGRREGGRMQGRVNGRWLIRGWSAVLFVRGEK